MTSADFESLAHQFSGQWHAIEQASPAERRVLIAELAKALAEWEAAQIDILDKIQNLKRVGYWMTLAQTVADQSQHIAEQLGQEKPALQARLQETRKRIDASESCLQNLIKETEALFGDLSSAEQELATLGQQETRLRQQIDSLHALSRLQIDLDRAKTDVAELEAQLQRGEDPSGLLEQMASLREPLMTYYRAYLTANTEIADSLFSTESEIHQPSYLSETWQIPERLIVLDRELKAIDQLLAEPLQQQDRQDQDIKART